MTEAVNESWFQEEGLLLSEWQPEHLAKAIQDIEESRKEPTPGRIAAALTFSFWTAMFGKDYKTLRQTILHKIGRKPDGKGLRRKDFSGPLAQIRSLRNRIAHHEPVIM
ncbi:Abi family protein [Sinorhizobium chiapasense]|uniref:Abi-like protein n=1 Tax=Sinorhizobium chiapasense TaxID=501572 RepID=A0ABZ2BFP3_9HYPH